MIGVDVVTVSIAMFDVLWEQVLDGLPKPAVLSTDSPGGTCEERRTVVNDATTRLRTAGHLGPVGVTDRLSSALHTVARPRLAIDLRIFERMPAAHRHPILVRQVGARLAVTGSAGVAALVTDEVLLWTFPGTSLIAETAGLLGEYPAPRRCPGLTVRADEFPVPVHHAASDPTLRQLARPYQRRARAIVVASSRVVGRPRVSPGLTVNDNDAGRFLVYQQGNLLVVSPGNRAALERRLRAMTSVADPGGESRWRH